MRVFGRLREADGADVVVALVGFELPAGRQTEVVRRFFKGAVVEHLSRHASFHVFAHHLDEGSVHAGADVILDVRGIDGDSGLLREGGGGEQKDQGGERRFHLDLVALSTNRSVSVTCDCQYGHSWPPGNSW